MKNLLFLISILFLSSVTVVAACQPTVTPDPDLCINLEGVQASVPEGYYVVEGFCTPLVIIDPSITPDTTAGLSATPTIEVPPAGHGDGLSDGRSDGRASCPECTKKPVIPYAAPATGRAL